MTTKVTILNHGPATLNVSGGTSGSVQVAPHEHAEMYVTSDAPLLVEETTVVVPNAGGGSGEEHGHS